MQEINYSPVIGKDHPCFIVAEAGINHNGDIKSAKELALRAKEAGADAVKFQTFIGGKELKHANITYDETKQLKKYCDEIGILFFSTPHTESAIDLLNPLVPIFKIASTFLNKILFIDKVLQQGKPTIISINEKAGPADIEVLEDYWRAPGNPPMYMLHTVCEYPANDPMFVILEMRKERFFVFDWGYSDHTKGIKNCIKAVNDFDACIIEKHFKIFENCVDSKVSATPGEFKEMVNEIRKLEKAKHPAQQANKMELDGKLPGKSATG
jgi:sialic acid synthase SpsE